MDIDKIFTYHNASGIDPKRFEEIRQAAKILGKLILKNGGMKGDIDRSILKLRECVFFAIASIVLYEVET